MAYTLVAPQVYQVPTMIPGTVDVLPQQKFMVLGNKLDDILVKGFLNQISNETVPFSSGDVIQMFYDYNLSTKQGTYGVFSVTIDNGVIQLIVAGGSAHLPVNEGHFANFYGSDGVIQDLGYYPSDSTASIVTMCKTNSVAGHFPIFEDSAGSIADTNVIPSTPFSNLVVMQYQPATAGAIPVYKDTNGTLEDQALVPSDISAKTISMVSGPVVTNEVAMFTDTTGTIKTSGVLLSELMRNDIIDSMAPNSAIWLDSVSAAVTGTPIGAVSFNNQAARLTTDDLTGLSTYSFVISNIFIKSNSIVDVKCTSGGTDAFQGKNWAYLTAQTDGSATVAVDTAGAGFNGTQVVNFYMIGTPA
jgi:hypothetical protein